MKKIFLTFGIALLGFTAVFAQDSDVYEPTETEATEIEAVPMESETEAVEVETEAVEEAVETEATETETDAIKAEDEVDAKTEESEAVIEE